MANGLEMALIGIERFLILEQRVGRAFDAIEMVPVAIANSIGARIVDDAQRSIGVYQAATAGPMGIYPEWEPLKESTLERRARSGVNPADEPLLETGEEQEAVTHTKPQRIMGENRVEFKVGFRGDSVAGIRAAVHEVGNPDHNEPARPVIGPSVVRVMNSPAVSGDVHMYVFNHFNILSD